MRDNTAAWLQTWMAAEYGALAVLAAAGSALVIATGVAAGNAIALRWHIRRRIRHAQDFANHPGVRALIRDINENREED